MWPDLAKARLEYETAGFIASLAGINRVVYNRDLALFYGSRKTQGV